MHTRRRAQRPTKEQRKEKISILILQKEKQGTKNGPTMAFAVQASFFSHARASAFAPFLVCRTANHPARDNFARQRKKKRPHPQRAASLPLCFVFPKRGSNVPFFYPFRLVPFAFFPQTDNSSVARKAQKKSRCLAVCLLPLVQRKEKRVPQPHRQTPCRASRPPRRQKAK